MKNQVNLTKAMNKFHGGKLFKSARVASHGLPSRFNSNFNHKRNEFNPRNNKYGQDIK